MRSPKKQVLRHPHWLINDNVAPPSFQTIHLLTIHQATHWSVTSLGNTARHHNRSSRPSLTPAPPVGLIEMYQSFRQRVFWHPDFSKKPRVMQFDAGSSTPPIDHGSSSSFSQDSLMRLKLSCSLVFSLALLQATPAMPDERQSILRFLGHGWGPGYHSSPSCEPGCQGSTDRYSRPNQVGGQGCFSRVSGPMPPSSAGQTSGSFRPTPEASFQLLQPRFLGGIPKTDRPSSPAARNSGPTQTGPSGEYLRASTIETRPITVQSQPVKSPTFNLQQLFRKPAPIRQTFLPSSQGPLWQDLPAAKGTAFPGEPTPSANNSSFRRAPTNTFPGIR